MTTTTKASGPRTWPDMFLFAGAALLLYFGWVGRHDSWISAEEGFGYMLGILGGSMMLALLLYPLRKKARWMQNLGPVSAWFRTHMWLGVLGPIAVLYHSNFQLGSTNSNVALFCMSTVALSGLVGRYFYTKVHRSLYSTRLDLAELRKDLTTSRAELSQILSREPEIDAAFKGLEATALSHSAGILHAWYRAWSLRFRCLLALSRARKALKQHASSPEEYKASEKFLRDHAQATYRIAEFALYDRLLALWHLLHLPLFILLVVAGIVHVIAVHMY